MWQTLDNASKNPQLSRKTDASTSASSKIKVHPTTHLTLNNDTVTTHSSSTPQNNNVHHVAENNATVTVPPQTITVNAINNISASAQPNKQTQAHPIISENANSIKTAEAWAGQMHLSTPSQAPVNGPLSVQKVPNGDAFKPAGSAHSSRHGSTKSRKRYVEERSKHSEGHCTSRSL